MSTCRAERASLHLAPEALLTRARLDAATLAARYPAVELRAGDPRLARLTAALRTLSPEPATQPSFDPRLLVAVHCEDGRKLTILASATAPDGRIHLSINGETVSTHRAFRKAVEGLAEPG